MIAAFVFVAFLMVCGVAAGVLGVWLAVRAQRHEGDDAVLLIKPPRKYVDADGRSDFRPELREAAIARRDGATR